MGKCVPLAGPGEGSKGTCHVWDYRVLDLSGRRNFPAERLRAMTMAIAHRGPDDEYFHREPGLALGTRRLAIVDLAGWRQPLANEDETVWVSFNGELLRQVATRMLPPQIANRPKTMFRAKLSQSFLGPHRPAWVDQLLSPESLRAAGYFDPRAVARERAAQVRWPRLTPRRFIFDVALTSVVATQLWHHLFFGGGLCDLPAWSAPAPPLARALPGQPSEDLAIAE